eukprot:scaffold435133_cov46-Prasinocladus_malaysianus.AAC.1
MADSEDNTFPRAEPPRRSKRSRLGADSLGGGPPSSSDNDADEEPAVDSAVVRAAEAGAPPVGASPGPTSAKPPKHKAPGGGTLDPGKSDGVKVVVEKPGATAVEVLRNKAGLRNSALRSVLKVFVMKCDPNYAQPWQMRPQRSSSGSAFVICSKTRKIITNSHVVWMRP